LGLRAGGDHPQTSETGGEPLPDSTDFKRDAFRENAHFTGPPSTGFPRRSARRRQPTDSVRLLTGQQCLWVNNQWQEQINQQVNYYYDSNPYDVPYSQNAWG